MSESKNELTEITPKMSPHSVESSSLDIVQELNFDPIDVHKKIMKLLTDEQKKEFLKNMGIPLVNESP